MYIVKPFTFFSLLQYFKNNGKMKHGYALYPQHVNYRTMGLNYDSKRYCQRSRC